MPSNTLTTKQQVRSDRRLPAATNTTLTTKQVGVIRSLAGAKPPFATIDALTTKQRRRLRNRLGGPLFV